MPFQVSGELVTTKSSRLLHVAGCDGAFVLATGAAFVATTSSADASVAQAEHDASRSRKPGIVVRQAVRAIALPYVHYDSNSERRRPLPRARLSDSSRRNASCQQRYNIGSIRSPHRPLTTTPPEPGVR